MVQALDGDTIVVADGASRETIRILGVDTPETHHPRKPVQCYGPEAAAFTQAHLEGEWVRLEDDVERHDIYGRRLAYVYLHGRRFEDVLLTRGYARLLVIEPNHAHARTMLDEELDARAAALAGIGDRLGRGDRRRPPRASWIPRDGVRVLGRAALARSRGRTARGRRRAGRRTTVDLGLPRPARRLADELDGEAPLRRRGAQRVDRAVLARHRAVRARAPIAVRAAGRLARPHRVDAWCSTPATRSARSPPTS